MSVAVVHKMFDAYPDGLVVVQHNLSDILHFHFTVHEDDFYSGGHGFADFLFASVAWTYQDAAYAICAEGLDQFSYFICAVVRTSEENCISVFVGDILYISGNHREIMV